MTSALPARWPLTARERAVRRRLTKLCGCDAKWALSYARWTDAYPTECRATCLRCKQTLLVSQATGNPIGSTLAEDAAHMHGYEITVPHNFRSAWQLPKEDTCPDPDA